MAALIPLDELMEPPVRQRYDMPEDPEVFDMLGKVSRQKELCVVVKMYWVTRGGRSVTRSRNSISSRSSWAAVASARFRGDDDL
jgi:hypothetical protein